jgi:hypothetical protein
VTSISELRAWIRSACPGAGYCIKAEILSKPVGETLELEVFVWTGHRTVRVAGISVKEVFERLEREIYAARIPDLSGLDFDRAVRS